MLQLDETHRGGSRNQRKGGPENFVLRENLQDCMHFLYFAKFKENTSFKRGGRALDPPLTHENNNRKLFHCYSMLYCVYTVNQCCKFPTHTKSAHMTKNLVQTLAPPRPLCPLFELLVTSFTWSFQGGTSFLPRI
jgi:hypothetical protein